MLPSLVLRLVLTNAYCGSPAESRPIPAGDPAGVLLRVPVFRHKVEARTEYHHLSWVTRSAVVSARPTPHGLYGKYLDDLGCGIQSEMYTSSFKGVTYRQDPTGGHRQLCLRIDGIERGTYQHHCCKRAGQHPCQIHDFDAGQRPVVCDG